MQLHSLTSGTEYLNLCVPPLQGWAWRACRAWQPQVCQLSSGSGASPPPAAFPLEYWHLKVVWQAQAGTTPSKGLVTGPL